MYLDEPQLIHRLSERYLALNLERIRAFALAGSDAVWIDDATATSEMISLDMYERFSLPYLKPLVKEIQRLGMKCILVYFGGIADRVAHIVSTGADALVMEASMKGYVNDIAAIAKRVDGRLCLFGNLNPFDDVERLSENQLWARMKAQYESVRPYRRFVTSTGSPLTPRTPVSRIRRYIEMAHALGS
jgi:uroporphyrinogen decarboxylase